MRLQEMLQFSQSTLNSVATELDAGEPWAIQNIYDNLEDYDIPDGKERILFRELLPEIVQWFEKAINHPVGYMTIDYAVYLIEHEKLDALIPFVIKILKANKHTVIKMLLTMIKTDNDYQQAKATHYHLVNFKLDWPELDKIQQSLKTIK